MDLSKRALQGTYPNKKVARMGSQFGMVVSVILIIVGGVGISMNKPYGWGSLIAGMINIISNIFNLKRIQAKSLD